jgi:hypothetical protein
VDFETDHAVHSCRFASGLIASHYEHTSLLLGPLPQNKVRISMSVKLAAILTVMAVSAGMTTNAMAFRRVGPHERLGNGHLGEFATAGSADLAQADFGIIAGRRGQMDSILVLSVAGVQVAALGCLDTMTDFDRRSYRACDAYGRHFQMAQFCRVFVGAPRNEARPSPGP